MKKGAFTGLQSKLRIRLSTADLSSIVTCGYRTHCRLLVLRNEQPMKFKSKLKQLYDVCVVNGEIQMSLYPQAATSRVRDTIRHTEHEGTPLTLLHGQVHTEYTQSFSSLCFIYFCIVFTSDIAQSRLGIFIVEQRNL